MKSHLSLRWFLSIQLGLALVVQSVIIAVLAWQVLLPQLRSQTEMHLHGLARAVAGEITAHMLGGERQLSAAAEHIETLAYIPDGHWIEMLDAQCANGDLFETIYIADYRKEAISAVGLSRARRGKRDDLMGLDLSGRDFLHTAKSIREVFWSESFLSTASSRMAVAVAIPLSNRAMIGEITVDQLSKVIRQLPVGSGLNTMILNRRGGVIADSQGVWGGKQIPERRLPVLRSEDDSAFGSVVFELDGRMLIGSVVPIDQLGWRVLVAQPQRDAYQSIRSTFETILVGLVIAIALAMVFSWLQARRLSQIFELFSDQVRSIAQGQYDVVRPEAKTREFVQLVDTLQQMALKIRGRERQIVNSENNLKITLDSIGDAVITTAVDGVINRMNPSAEQLTGWTFAEANGKHVSEVFHIVNGKSRDIEICPVQRVLEQGKVVGLANHTVLMARNGDEYQIADSAAPILQADGSIIGVVMVFRNVTESYAQERIIRENEKRLKDITSNVPEVVYQFESTRDHVYTMTFVSERAADILELKADPRTFLTEFQSCIPDEELDRFRASVRMAGDKVIPWQYEGQFIKPSGEKIWYSGNAVPHREGAAIVFNGVLMDITERKQLEESLRRTKFCFDKASIGIFWIGDHGQILNVNEKACHSLGYSMAELCSLKVFDIDPNFNVEMWPRHIENLRRLKTRSIETQHKHKSGHVFPVQILINLMIFEDQEFHVAFVEDISDRKIAAQENKRLESALLQSQKMEAIGTLAGGIAHDFNNILSAVIGYSELALNEAEKGTRQIRHLEQVIVAGMRARDLVQQILTFSRQEECELKLLQVGPLVKEALKLLRSTVPATIDIQQQIAADVDDAMADPTQIHRIVMNLCTNAVHAMEENGGQLTVALSQVKLSPQDIRLRPGLTPGNYIKLIVQDTGHGIAPEIRDKIFDPYFTTKGRGKGTGLGLSVVHGILHNYGGAIFVYSEQGSGTTITVYIPAIEKHRLPAVSEELQLPTGSERILLVDDEPSLIEVGQSLLEKLGYKVTTCGCSLDALEIFQKGPGDIDLVISDVTMPKMTGDQLATQLLQTRKDIPIILCTGFSNKISKERAVQIGVKALAMKPLLKNEFAYLVRKILDEAKQNK